MVAPTFILNPVKLASLDVLIPMPAPRNYSDPDGPRYAGGAAPATGTADVISLVTFNIKFAARIDKAIELLRLAVPLRDPDVLLLQEMDAPGTERIAAALGLAYVYYPNTVHPIARKDFGCAILSRWPIADDRKILLPHVARLRRVQRAAVAATISVGARRLRVYNVHLATMVDNGPKQRRAQLDAVLDDAAAWPGAVIAGDFNSPRVPLVAARRGFRWPTRRIGPTNAIWALDHVLLKGVDLETPTSFGSVRDTVGASDHKPVWARIRL